LSLGTVEASSAHGARPWADTQEKVHGTSWLQVAPLEKESKPPVFYRVRTGSKHVDRSFAPGNENRANFRPKTQA
jgi:hypothetical protein